MSLVFTTLFCLFTLSGANAQGWILGQVLAMGITRMDPIVNPNGVANHVHNILGGSAFDRVINEGEQMKSDCSTTMLQADKSTYWAPQLYYRYPDNTLAPMMGGSRIYYFIKGPDVKPFPPGLRMITGVQHGRNASAYEAMGIQISCSGGGRGPFMPNSTSHPGGCGGLSMGIFFPSCGLADGSLDSDDHFSHMAWPMFGPAGGRPGYANPNAALCPPSHPIKYPTIFLEHNYYFGDGEQVWRNEENLVVLSNGDALGTSYHADFVNGWDQDVLKGAIKDCRSGVGEDLNQCPHFKPHVDLPAARACRLQSQIPDEPVGIAAPIKKLPGCNPIWPSSASDEKPGCDDEPKAAEPGYVYPNAYFNNLHYRMNIPIVDPRATEDMITDKKYYPNVYQPLAPKHIGNKGESGILKWGPQAHGLTLNVGTLAQIAQNWVGNDGIKGDGLPANMTVPDNNLSGSSSISKISSAASTAATGKSSAAASTGKSSAASASATKASSTASPTGKSSAASAGATKASSTVSPTGKSSAAVPTGSHIPNTGNNGAVNNGNSGSASLVSSIGNNLNAHPTSAPSASGTGKSAASASGTGKSSASASGTGKSVASASGTGKSTASASGTGKSTASASGTGKSSAPASGTGKSTASASGTGKSAAAASGTGKSTASASGTGMSSASASGTGMSTASASGTGKSTASASGTGKSVASASGTGKSSASAASASATTVRPNPWAKPAGSASNTGTAKSSASNASLSSATMPPATNVSNSASSTSTAKSTGIQAGTSCGIKTKRSKSKRSKITKRTPFRAEKAERRAMRERRRREARGLVH